MNKIATSSSPLPKWLQDWLIKNTSSSEELCTLVRKLYEIEYLSAILQAEYVVFLYNRNELEASITECYGESDLEQTLIELLVYDESEVYFIYHNTTGKYVNYEIKIALTEED